jgi:hypothetical protein
MRWLNRWTSIQYFSLKPIGQPKLNLKDRS